MIQTVRVANPADPTKFMTINASDYREVVHGPLWKDQAPDFAGVPAPTPQRMDPAVRDLAAGLMFNSLDMHRMTEGKEPFSSLSPPQQLVALRDFSNDFEKAKTQFLRDRQLRDRQDEEAGMLGQGHSSEPDLSRLASDGAPTPPPATEAPAAPAPAAAPGEKPAEPAPAPAATPPGGTPWAQPQAPAAQPVALTVEKGPGSKWFVMQGKEPKSPGFATKAEAETARAELVKE